MSFFKPITHHQSTITNLTDNLENCIQSGTNFRAKCPICGSDSSRPFVLFENGGYYCHSCNEKGGAFSLIKDILKLDFSSFKDTFNRFNPFHKTTKNKTPNFTYQQKKFHKSIEKNRKRIFELLYELIPEATKDLKHSKNNQYIGYDDKNDTLAINLIDEKNNIVNIKRRQVNDIKWLGLKGGSGKFAPSRVTGKKYVFVASGIAEFLILNASDLDYIVMQSDGIDINALLPRAVTAVILEDNDKKEIVNQADKRYACFKNPHQFNPFKKKVTEKITGDKIAIDFEKVLNKELKAGYDLRDFIKDEPSHWLKLIEQEIEKQLPPSPVEEEIVFNYTGQFPTFKTITQGVVVSKQHTGKTYQYEGVEGTLIIVPKSRQCNMFKGDNTVSVLEKIFKDGAIITFHKFYGHYTSNAEFKELIDSKKIRLIIDEAHELTLNLGCRKTQK